MFRNNFLPYSETFIFDSLKFYNSFKPIVIAKKRFNQDRFPFEPVYISPLLSRGSRITHFLFSSENESTHTMQQITNHKPQIAHAHFGQSGVLAMPYARIFNIPLIVTLHGNDVGILLGRQKFQPKCWYYTGAYRSIIRRTTLFLAVSEELKDRFTELGCPPEKIRVHRLGINLEKFRITHNRQNDNSILSIVMIGRLVEKKGFFYGIKAFASVLRQFENQSSSDINLVIIGDGKLEVHLKNLVQELGLSNHVRFLGKQSHQNVKKHLQKATILICPSVVARNQDRDSGLIVAKEAAACGIPLIGTQHGGIPDIIENNKTGYLVPERDIDALSQCLKKLLTNSEMRRKFGHAARSKMEREYNIKHRMAELESIYFETIKQFSHNKFII